jgi:hypothetical protein
VTLFFTPPVRFTPAMTTAECIWDPSTFAATAIYTGENRIIKIEGSGTCPTTGWTHQLEEDNPGINPDPDELVVRIVSSKPDIGGDALTDTTVEGFFEVQGGESWVVLRALDLRLAVKEPA